MWSVCVLGEGWQAGEQEQGLSLATLEGGLCVSTPSQQKQGPACAEVEEDFGFQSKTWVLGTPCQCGSFPGTSLSLLRYGHNHLHP